MISVTFSAVLMTSFCFCFWVYLRRVRQAGSRRKTQRQPKRPLSRPQAAYCALRAIPQVYCRSAARGGARAAGSRDRGRRSACLSTPQPRPGFDATHHTPLLARPLRGRRLVGVDVGDLRLLLAVLLERPLHLPPTASAGAGGAASSTSSSTRQQPCLTEIHPSHHGLHRPR